MKRIILVSAISIGIVVLTNCSDINGTGRLEYPPRDRSRILALEIEDIKSDIGRLELKVSELETYMVGRFKSVNLVAGHGSVAERIAYL